MQNLHTCDIQEAMTPTKSREHGFHPIITMMRERNPITRPLLPGEPFVANGPSPFLYAGFLRWMILGVNP
jgi:hypothetical protein